MHCAFLILLTYSFLVSTCSLLTVLFLMVGKVAHSEGICVVDRIFTNVNREDREAEGTVPSQPVQQVDHKATEQK